MSQEQSSPGAGVSGAERDSRQPKLQGGTQGIGKGGGGGEFLSERRRPGGLPEIVGGEKSSSSSRKGCPFPEAGELFPAREGGCGRPACFAQALQRRDAHQASPSQLTPAHEDLFAGRSVMRGRVIRNHGVAGSWPRSNRGPSRRQIFRTQSGEVSAPLRILISTHEIMGRSRRFNFGETDGVLFGGEMISAWRFLPRLMTLRISCWVKRW